MLTSKIIFIGLFILFSDITLSASKFNVAGYQANNHTRGPSRQILHGPKNLDKTAVVQVTDAGTGKVLPPTVSKQPSNSASVKQDETKPALQVTDSAGQVLPPPIPKDTAVVKTTDSLTLKGKKCQKCSKTNCDTTRNDKISNDVQEVEPRDTKEVDASQTLNLKPAPLVTEFKTDLEKSEDGSKKEKVHEHTDPRQAHGLNASSGFKKVSEREKESEYGTECGISPDEETMVNTHCDSCTLLENSNGVGVTLTCYECYHQSADKTCLVSRKFDYKFTVNARYFDKNTCERKCEGK